MGISDIFVTVEDMLEDKHCWKGRDGVPRLPIFRRNAETSVDNGRCGSNLRIH